MTTVLNFPGTYVEPSLSEAIDKTIHDAFHYATEETREQATLAALKVVRGGGTFLQAMDEAEATIYANGYRFVRLPGQAEPLLMFPARHHQHGLRERLRRAKEIIRERLQDQDETIIAPAMTCAERVINGNGTVAAAVHFACAHAVALSEMDGAT